jgi:hypothetical protein
LTLGKGACVHSFIFLFDFYTINIFRSHDNLKMGQMLSREDEDEHEPITPEVNEDCVHEEKPKPRRQRNAAVRSRKPRASTAQGRTRRARANPVTFEVRDY